MHKLAPASLWLAAIVFPVAALADTSSDVLALKREIEVLRSEYEARIKALELRVEQATASAPAPSSAPVVAAAPAPSTPTAPAGFNPAMSLILSGGYARTSRDPADYRIRGFALPPGSETGPGTRGFSLAETELGLSASIDPWLRGAANISLLPDGGVAVEEAFVQTTSLGRGLSLKAGRFLSGIGYLNSQHAHAWDFVDAPLAYQAFLGTQFGDDGVQLTWLAPTERFIEVGLEAGRGRSFPGDGSGRNGTGMTAITLHTGGDIGESHSWRAGLSVLGAKASDQALSSIDTRGTEVTSLFTGRRRVWVLDGVWKWAPEGNATRTNFKLQGEYLRSTGTGSMTYDPSGIASADGYRAAQSGWYVQAVYQFMPRWRAGVRAERLDPGSPDYGINNAALAGDGFRPAKTSAMLDFNPSEFSRVRLQLARDNARGGRPDNQLFIQYQMSLGAHGAHGF
ncbi:hypothetical protein [Caenimonas aquaedulcis]|uniref:TonB-dependent receptor n=1 Tax=Caenimonas aquaedulcis TaxID=2793270 RepID=A0A931H5W8_9BURK|nr:hypothetical protein [Caenimonas aquaedulcis]MBG9389219.1 hypothetical protein [Caenimonas aquaedulcis]